MTGGWKLDSSWSIPVWLFIVITVLMISVLSACSNNQRNGDTSNSPEQTLAEYWQSTNDKDCEKNLGLRSANNPMKKNMNHEEALKNCKEFQTNSPTFSVTVNSITNDGEKSTIDYDLNTTGPGVQGGNITNMYNAKAFLSLEDGTWKIDGTTIGARTSESQ
jgi:hypothetical protein